MIVRMGDLQLASFTLPENPLKRAGLVGLSDLVPAVFAQPDKSGLGLGDLGCACQDGLGFDLGTDLVSNLDWKKWLLIGGGLLLLYWLMTRKHASAYQEELASARDDYQSKLASIRKKYPRGHQRVTSAISAAGGAF